MLRLLFVFYTSELHFLFVISSIIFLTKIQPFFSVRYICKHSELNSTLSKIICLENPDGFSNLLPRYECQVTLLDNMSFIFSFILFDVRYLDKIGSNFSGHKSLVICCKLYIIS